MSLRAQHCIQKTSLNAFYGYQQPSIQCFHSLYFWPMSDINNTFSDVKDGKHFGGISEYWLILIDEERQPLQTLITLHESFHQYTLLRVQTTVLQTFNKTLKLFFRTAKPL